MEITCSAPPSQAGGNGEWIVPILQMEHERHWSPLCSPSEKEERGNPHEPSPVYCFHGGILGAPFAFSVSHSRESTAPCHAASSLGCSCSDLQLQPLNAICFLRPHVQLELFITLSFALLYLGFSLHLHPCNHNSDLLRKNVFLMGADTSRWIFSFRNPDMADSMPQGYPGVSAAVSPSPADCGL